MLLFLGDSITATNTYPEIIRASSASAGKEFRLINRAVGGAGVINGTSHLSAQVSEASNDNANKIFIMIGVNDGIYTDAWKNEYQNQVEILKSTNPNATIYLVGVLDVYSPASGVRTYQNPLISTIAASTGENYIDTDGLILAEDLVADGIHPVSSGYTKIANLLIPYAY